MFKFFCFSNLRGLLAILFLAFAIPASAEYRLNPGDVIEISVVGIPELSLTAAIESDGRIAFPLMERIVLSGLTLHEARAKIRGTLGSKIYKQLTRDGSEASIMIRPGDITITIAKYRPIYIAGDVVKPGEYTFRPGFTVRQAIAMGGGYKVFAAVTPIDPVMSLMDLKSEREVLWTEFVREKARVWRLKTEIKGQEPDKKALLENIPANVPVSQSMISNIVNLAMRQLEVSRSNLQKEQVFVEDSIKKLDEQITVFSAQEEKEKEGTEADAEELEKLVALFKRGTLLRERLTGARRAVLLSATRKLQTTAQLIELKTQKDTLSRQLEKLRQEHKLKLLGELETSTIKLTEAESKLSSVAAKMNHVSNLSPQQMLSKRGGTQIVIFRKNNDGWTRMSADESSELMPGDVLEINLRADYFFPQNQLSDARKEITGPEQGKRNLQ